MTRQKIDERFLQSIDEGFQKARIGALKGALRRAAQALQDVHAKGGNVGVNDEAAVALANASVRSGKTWQQAVAQAKVELASGRVWPGPQVRAGRKRRRSG
jgi:hypothetical protein